jgi:hypothetical protein
MLLKGSKIEHEGRFGYLVSGICLSIYVPQEFVFEDLGTVPPRVICRGRRSIPDAGPPQTLGTWRMYLHAAF